MIITQIMTGRYGNVVSTVAQLFRFLIRYLHCFINTDHIYPTPPLRQDMTQGQFLSVV